MRQYDKTNQTLELSYNKKKISKRLVELKDKYQDLLTELNHTSIDNIDKVFGYSNNDLNEIESDIFIDKINENLEIQDKIRILKNNIATKIQNIEKINSLNVSNKSFDDIKKQISNSLEMLNDINIDKQQTTNNDQSNLILEKISSLENDIKNIVNKKQISQKDEDIYKDEIAFLKYQIDKLLLENKECKSKLNELAYINNEKEEEINKSYNAWVKNASRLNELESLLLKENEENINLHMEKDQVIDTLENKINDIKNENNIYDQFSQDVYYDQPNVSNTQLLDAIDQKFNDLKIELINNKFTTKDIENASLNMQQYEHLREQAKQIYVDTLTDLLKKLLDKYIAIINKLDNLIPLFTQELYLLIEPVANDVVDPSNDIDLLTNDLINVDEYVDLSFETTKENDNNLFNWLDSIKTLSELKSFINHYSTQLHTYTKNILDNRLLISDKVNSINFTDKLFSTNYLFNTISDLTNRLHNFINLLNSEVLMINDSNSLYELDQRLSQSHYWFEFVDLINSLQLLISYQDVIFDNLESEVDIFNKIKLEFENSNNNVSDNTYVEGDSIDNLRDKNKKLKNIFDKLINLEKLVDLYEIDQFENFVENM